MEPITITITVEKTDNPKVFKVEAQTCAGRGEVKNALMGAAKSQIAGVLDELFPKKGA
jgi:hypothetical protein